MATNSIANLKQAEATPYEDADVAGSVSAKAIDTKQVKAEISKKKTAKIIL